MPAKATFASRLKELRGTMKQEEFGAKIGVSRGSISYYENGARTADIEILDKLCRTYEVSADWLIGLSSTRTTNTTIKEVCEYTGLSETSVSWLAKINTASVNNKDSFMSCVNAVLENTRFHSAMYNIYNYLIAVSDEAKREYNRRQLVNKSNISQIDNSKRVSDMLLDILKQHRFNVSNLTNTEQDILFNDLIGYRMREIYAYQASNDFSELLNDIAIRTEKATENDLESNGPDTPWEGLENGKYPED